MRKKASDPRDVAIAALTNMIRLMGAELVAGRHRDDLAVFEEAVRRKAEAFTIDGFDPAVLEAGLELARSQIELALASVELQALKVSSEIPTGVVHEKPIVN